MAYVYPNFKTKKACKKALHSGEDILVLENTPSGQERIKGPITVSVEGPHYPEPHCWYGKARVDENSKLISIT